MIFRPVVEDCRHLPLPVMPLNVAVARFGRIDEWHVIFFKSLGHFEFDLPSRLCEAVVVFRPSFRHAGLKSVGSIRDTVLGDRV